MNALLQRSLRIARLAVERSALGACVLCLRATAGFRSKPFAQPDYRLLICAPRAHAESVTALLGTHAADAVADAFVVDTSLSGSAAPERLLLDQISPGHTGFFRSALYALRFLRKLGVAGVVAPAADTFAVLRWMIAAKAARIRFAVLVTDSGVPPIADRWLRRLDWFVVRRSPIRLALSARDAESLASHYGAEFSVVAQPRPGVTLRREETLAGALGLRSIEISLPPHLFEKLPPSSQTRDPMRIVQVTGHDLLGIEAGGYLLHRELRKRGHESFMLVNHKLSPDPHVEEIGGRLRRAANRAVLRLQTGLSLLDTLPVTSLALPRHDWVRDADVVNLQVVHNGQFFNLMTLPALSHARPLILSLHDMYFLTGHCVYSMNCQRWTTGCGSCPDLKLPFALRRDNTAYLWRKKKKAFDRSNLRLVVHSPWMLDRVRRSPYLARFPVHLVRFGLDPRVFHPDGRRAAREALGIPPDAHVIAFRATPPSVAFKGIQFIEEALQRYTPSRETILLTLEYAGAFPALRKKYRFIDSGWLMDPRQVASTLSAADIFLMPSVAEAFGLMAIEAMACGTPVVVFEGTALPDTVNAPECGVVVPRDAAALADAIRQLLADEPRRAALAANAIRYVRKHHQLDDYVSSCLDVYREAAAARPKTARHASAR